MLPKYHSLWLSNISSQKFWSNFLAIFETYKSQEFKLNGQHREPGDGLPMSVALSRQKVLAECV